MSRGWQEEEISPESLWWSLLENGHLQYQRKQLGLNVKTYPKGVLIKADGTRSCAMENLWCRNRLQILHCWLARCGNSLSKIVLVPWSNRISFEALTFRGAPVIFSSRFLDSLTKLTDLQQDSIFLVFYVHVILPTVFYFIFKNSNTLTDFSGWFRLNSNWSKTFDIIVP